MWRAATSRCGTTSSTTQKWRNLDLTRVLRSSSSSSPSTRTAAPLSSTAVCIGRFDKLQTRYFASSDATTGQDRWETLNQKTCIKKQQQSQSPPDNSKTSHNDNSGKKKKFTLKETTDRILSVSAGSWGEEEWKSAESALAFWMHHPKKNMISMRRSFEILERMVQEAEKNGASLGSVVTTQHLNQALYRWKVVSRKPNIDKDEWSAPNILSMMDKITSKIPSVELDTKSYAIIMDAHIKHNPKNAYKLCNELVERLKDSTMAAPNTFIYSLLIEAHVKSNQKDGAAIALSVFDEMMKNPTLVPDEKTLTRAFQALVMSEMTLLKAIPYIQHALNHCLEFSVDPKDALPNSIFLDLVLEYCRDQLSPKTRLSMVPLADALMTVVSETAKDVPRLEPKPASYYNIIYLWANSYLPDAARNAEMWLEKMLQQYKLNFDSTDEDLDQKLACYAAVAQSWAKCNLADATDRAGTWLCRMMDEVDRVAEIKAEPADYSLVATAWAQSGLQVQWSRQDDVVRFLLQMIKPGMMYRMKHNQGTVSRLNKFTGTLKEFVKKGNINQAIHILERASETFPGVFDDVATGTGLYHEVVKSILKDSTVRKYDFAREFLKETTERYISGSTYIKPSSKSFGAVMLEASNEGNIPLVGELWIILQDLQCTNEHDPDFMPDADVLTALCKTNAGSVAREDSVLHGMLKGAKSRNKTALSEALLDFVLDSLAKSGDPTAGKRAETILLKMQELYEDGVLPKPTFKTFQKVIDCWVASEEDGFAERAEEILGLAESLADAGDDDMQPTCAGYTSVMTAWGKSHAFDAPERIQRIVRRMKEKSKEGKISFDPSEEAYNALLLAYANSGRDNAGRMAQTVFDGAPKEFKGTRLYNSLIAAQGGDSSRAEAILHEMHKAFLDGNTLCKPNTESFNNVLLAWSRSGSPMAAWRADGIFHRMSDLTKSGDLDVRPNGTTFDIVITVISNEWGADAATKVDRYLELLKEYYSTGEPDCVPGVASYTEAIRAWGSNVDDPRAVLRAKALLDEMHELARAGASTVRPDRSTYLVYLQALSQSSLEDKEELARDALLSMKRNNIVLDKDLILQWQRCSLPMRTMTAYWTILQEDTDEFPSTMVPTKDETVNAFP